MNIFCKSGIFIHSKEIHTEIHNYYTFRMVKFPVWVRNVRDWTAYIQSRERDSAAPYVRVSLFFTTTAGVSLALRYM